MIYTRMIIIIVILVFVVLFFPVVYRFVLLFTLCAQPAALVPAEVRLYLFMSEAPFM